MSEAGDENTERGGEAMPENVENPEAVSPEASGSAAELPEDGTADSAAERLEALEVQVADLNDKLLRALAETENVRRRSQREREDAARYATAAFAKDLCGVADNLRRAIESIPAEARAADANLESLIAGVEMTERELLTAFERHNIRRIEPFDEKFDHNFHQAMFEVENSGKPAGTIVQVLQIGYALHDRLLRPAMVGVAKGEEKPESPGLDTTV